VETAGIRRPRQHHCRPRSSWWRKQPRRSCRTESVDGGWESASAGSSRVVGMAKECARLCRSVISTNSAVTVADNCVVSQARRYAPINDDR